jgi:DNA-binding MarR family transcriptional regulator
VEDFHGSSSLKPRLLQFTASGRALYEEMVELALRREEKLREGLTAGELAELLRMLRILFENTDHLDQLEYHMGL